LQRARGRSTDAGRMEEHLERQTEEKLRAGMNVEEARRQACEIRWGGDSKRGLPRGAESDVL